MMRLLLDRASHQVETLARAFPLVLGQLATPLTRKRIWEGPWAADNGCYASWNPERWKTFLARRDHMRETCLFVSIPDVVGDALATLRLFDKWASVAVGWPHAFVAQDGAELLELPWDRIDALFIGGTTEWKMSQAALDLVDESKRRKKLSHVGRVNTVKRWEHFNAAGVDTFDGSGVSRFDHMLYDLIENAKVA